MSNNNRHGPDDPRFCDSAGFEVWIDDEVCCTLQGWEEYGRVIDKEIRGEAGWVAIEFPFGRPMWHRCKEVTRVPF